jgi:divalent metal cation (Fe/Co/Zn/Cd) transporter
MEKEKIVLEVNNLIRHYETILMRKISIFVSAVGFSFAVLSFLLNQNLRLFSYILLSIGVIVFLTLAAIWIFRFQPDRRAQQARDTLKSILNNYGDHVRVNEHYTNLINLLYPSGDKVICGIATREFIADDVSTKS